VLIPLKKSWLCQACTGKLETMKKENKLQVRNSTAEFLIFTRQAGEDGIEVRVADETVWLTQKLMAALFEATIPTINERLANLREATELYLEEFPLPESEAPIPAAHGLARLM
jgi:hypothetical protein